jgi:4-amino-4-deoxy-L-arabinose transferase-like glycosyltransferase
MSSTITIPPVPVDSPSKPPARGWSPLWGRISLGVIILVSIFMNFYQLGQNGYGNAYYAAGVKSMGDSLHNFFFVAFDPGGFVTIDKPPLGFWLQVISTKVFGFTAFSIFLPQALAGVISVWILYILVKRHFGITAGLIAAFALAASPISVVTNRNNTIDSMLTLVMLLGVWAVMKAAESGKLRWLIMTAVLVGIGFNIKMMEAYLVVPAYGLLYVMAAPRKIWTRIWHLAVAVVIMVVISLSWVLVVDLIPAALRPYVGSTQNNSEISLALGYNGVSRLLGNNIGGGGGAGGSAGSFGTGIPGVLRLFEAQLGSQIAWLLPFALLAIVALAWQRRWRFREDPQQQSMLLWGGWLVTMGVFFSVAGFFHQYYLTVMAPSICALFGIGVVVMWNDYRRRGWHGWLLPIALILTAAEQIYMISAEPAWGTWLIPVIAVTCGVAALTLIIVRLVPRIVRRERVPGLLKAMVVVGLIGLMLTPFIWSAAPGVQNVVQDLPSAGPSGEGGFGGGSQSNTTDAALIKYLEVNQGSTKYLVATSSSNTADTIILETNKPVMALGGFTGSDPILTTAQLQALIKNGTVRYFLLGGGIGGGAVGTGARAGGFNRDNLPTQIHAQIAAQGDKGGPPTGSFGGSGGGAGGSQSTLTSWVTQNCKVVSASSWQSSSSSSSSQGGSQLYDCVAAK